MTKTVKFIICGTPAPSTCCVTHRLEAKENEMVRQLMDYMSLPAAGAQVLVGLAALVLGIFGTCRHRVNVDGPGCIACDRRVNSVTQFVLGWIIAGFPAHLICPASEGPRVVPNRSRLLFWQNSGGQ